MPTCPSPCPCYLVFSHSVVLFFSPSLYPSSPPLSALPPFNCLCLPPLAMQPANAIRSAPLLFPLAPLLSLSLPQPSSRNVLSRFNLHDRSHPHPRFHFAPRPFPRRDFLPSSVPTPARFLLLIVPAASILNPLSFHLARFRGYANGVLSALFFRGQFPIPRKSHVALDGRPFALVA